MTEEIVNQCVLTKTFTCNVCDNDFTEQVVRTTKLKFISSDIDLHPNYEPLDPLLYDVIICPLCGYSAMTMFFNKVSEKQIPLIRNGITSKFKPRVYNKILSYEDAIDRYKLALITAMVRGAKKGEIGYICTKIAWLNRLRDNDKGYKEFAKKAVTELELAYQQEDFPICQMDESTFGYLISYFQYISEQYEDSLRWVGRVLTNRSISERLKDKSYELKALIQDKLKSR